ncbi:MAG: hypothetical protein DRJ42_28110 [Deltaproteobacteria bacterium]|nr:MAG: hypothetical protein DRJ42_28110 [Deltaproteobacteria bacterium]
MDLIDDDVLAAFGLPVEAPEAPREPAPIAEYTGALRGEMRDPETVRRYILGGHGTFTARSLRTGSRLTFRLSRPRHSDAGDARIYVRVLTGPENTADYTWLGTFRTADRDWRGRTYAAGWTHSRKSDIGESAPSARTVAWLLPRVLRGGRHLDAVMEQTEFWHEGRCGACGRKLTVPESIKSGIGPVCAGRAA